MVSLLPRRSQIAALATTIALVACGVAMAAGSAKPDPRELAVQSSLSAADFDDAEFGVDPMVTGPVSASFKDRQAALGCDRAVWPKIPRGCYPD